MIVHQNGTTTILQSGVTLVLPTAEYDCYTRNGINLETELGKIVRKLDRHYEKLAKKHGL